MPLKAKKLFIKLKGKKQLFIFSIFIIFIILFALKPITNEVDYSLKRLIYNIGPNRLPDSNIVLLTISHNDIEQLGGWPLRRSYYALVINRLSKLGVKRIGLEVFLSSTNTFQNYYDNVLVDEIKKSGNVVVSSYVVLGNDGKDSLIYSQPKLISPSIESGHINFISDGRIVVPQKFLINNRKEKSFSSVLAQKDVNSSELNVNLFTSWEYFKKISVLDFLRLSDEEQKNLSLKNKYVLIGVIDPTLSKSIRSNYDDNVPGIALHAFALDNIIENRSLNNLYNLIATFLLIALLLLFFSIKTNFGKTLHYVGQIIFFIIVIILLYRVFNIEVYSPYLFVTFFVFVGEEMFIAFKENKSDLQSSFDENVYLKNLLSIKESKLKELENSERIEVNSEKDSLIQEISQLKNEIAYLNKDKEEDRFSVQSQHDVKIFESIVYKSDKIQKLISMLEKIAPYDATVLIQGESGSGKELFAKALHNLSKRKNDNFIALNCAAIPESLLESELFGHVKGAFTNAVAEKKGKFELADKGTLFLDEIGETSEAFQTKLLRAIQFGEFYKVGSTNSQKVDVRIVAATNKNLDKEVKENRFREDLYYRLNVLKIEIPPLRDRKEDIEILANHFSTRNDETIKLSSLVIDSLQKNEWKGNVRELESVITHSLIMAKADKRNIIKITDIPEEYRKYSKNDLELMVLHSMRAKQFSYSSVSETAKELGGLNRTVVSETLRGLFLKTYVESDFNFENTVNVLADSTDEKLKIKVHDKLKTYLENINIGLLKLKNKDFEAVKENFLSKYKNLPSKYHEYLDIIIKEELKSMDK